MNSNDINVPEKRSKETLDALMSTGMNELEARLCRTLTFRDFRRVMIYTAQQHYDDYLGILRILATVEDLNGDKRMLYYQNNKGFTGYLVLSDKGAGFLSY